jgi:hypothetical protein
MMLLLLVGCYIGWLMRYDGWIVWNDDNGGIVVCIINHIGLVDWLLGWLVIIIISSMSLCGNIC